MRDTLTRIRPTMRLFSPPRILLPFFAIALLSGCVQTRVISSSWDQLKQSEWYTPPNTDKEKDSSGARTNRGYAIELARFSGEGMSLRAFKLVSAAQQEAGLANLWRTTTGRETVIYCGRFREADSDEAKAQLRRVRSAKIEGDTPFESAKIVPMTSSRNVSVDPRDLRSLSGNDLYSLQVGYFDENYGEDFREAAEARVDALRKKGENAYYYHGPFRSSVLINAWRYSEAFMSRGTQDGYSNAVRAVREEYPYNLPNGRSFSGDEDPAFLKSQESKLIRVPNR